MFSYLLQNIFSRLRISKKILKQLINDNSWWLPSGEISTRYIHDSNVKKGILPSPSTFVNVAIPDNFNWIKW